MALTAYNTKTRRLLHDATAQFYSDGDLTAYINEARSQIAVEGECVRFLASLNTVASTETYAFPTAVSTGTGYKDVIQVKGIAVGWGGSNSTKPALAREDWSYFQAQYRFFGGTFTGNPIVFTTYGPKVYLWPIPSAVFPMEWDTITNVIDLAADSDPEAIPYPFTDCVPYYAAYLALSNAQRPEEAQSMFGRFDTYMKRARAFSQQTYTPWLYGAS